jgi:hypothetical protein
VGFSNLSAKLHRYATGTLHLAAVGAQRAGVFEASDLVNTLLLKGLAGELPWALPEDATEDDIVRHACKMLHSMCANCHRHAALAAGDDDAIDGLRDGAPDALAGLIARRQVAEVVEACAPDAEASVYLRMTLAGEKRADIIEALGCTEKHADVVRKRIGRVVAALHAKERNR